MQYWQISSKKLYNLEKFIFPDQRWVIEQAKFTYSPLGNVFKKQAKMIEEQRKKQIHAITNQSKKMAVLNNKDDDHYKQILEELVKGRFDEIKELTSEINKDEFLYYFKGHAAKKWFDDFNNGTKSLKK